MDSDQAPGSTPDQSSINMKNEVEEKTVHILPQILAAPDQTTKPTFDPIIFQQQITSLNHTITNQNENIATLNTQYSNLREQHDKYKNIIERQEMKITELERQVARITEFEGRVARIIELERSRNNAPTYPSSSAASVSKVVHLSGAARPAPISPVVAVLCKQKMLDEVLVLLSSKISNCTFSGHVADASDDAEPPPVSPSAKVIVCVMQTTNRSHDADKVIKYIEKLRSKGLHVFVLFLVYGSEVPTSRKVPFPHGDLPFQRPDLNGYATFSYSGCHAALEQFLGTQQPNKKKSMFG